MNPRQDSNKNGDLTESEIREFQEIWKEDFGEDISYDRAEWEIRRLMFFFDQLYEGFYGNDADDPSDNDMPRS